METALIVYTQGDETPYVMDLYLNETISLQYSFTDIKDLKAKATYSRTFRIPATDNNSKIFGFIENNTFQFSSFNPKRKLNAIITVDTLPVMEGNIQWKASYTQQGKISEYEIVFFGNVIDFFKNIGDADFKNYIAVELQDDFPIVINYANVFDYNQDSFASNLIKFGLTDRGNNWVGIVNTAGTRSIYSNSVSNVIKAGELTPFVSCAYIWQTIMNLSGFEIDYGGSFWTTELSESYVPFTSESNTIQQIGNAEQAKFLLQNFSTNPQFSYTDFTLQTVNNESQYIYEIPNLIEISDAGSNVLNNTYTAPFSGTYLITAGANLSLVSPYVGTNATQMQLIFIKTNNSSVQTLQGSSPFIQWYTYDSNYNEVYFTDVNTALVIGNTYTQQVYLEAGETIRPVIYLGDGTYFTLQSEGTVFEIQSMDFKCDQLSKPLYNNEIDWVANAPVMKCSDFINAIFKAFNLVVIPNEFNAKKLSILTLQEYLGPGNQKDWSNKIDISKDIVLTPTTDLQANVNTWTYKKSDDYLNNLYNTQGNRVYGRLQLLDPQNDFATDEMKIELEFGSTPLALIQGTDYPIPKFINSSVEYVNPTPRILYECYNQFLPIHFLNDDTMTIDTNFQLPMFHHYEYYNGGLSTKDWNFGQETPLHPVDSIPYKTLYARYYNDYIENIYAPDARIMTAFFALEFADIYNFKYNDEIFIKDSYWRILQIKDYVVGMQESVQVQLMKLVNVTPDCLLTPVAIDTNGQVQFYDANNDPAAATEICCENYGYSWDGTACYAFIRDGGTTKPQDTTGIGKPTVNVDRDILANFVNGDSNIVKFGNENSFVSGTNNFLDSFNDNSLVVGKNLIVQSNLGSPIVALGSNANVINKGMTIGGAGSYNGQVQSGIVHLFGNGDFTDNTTYIDLKIEGVDNYNIPTNTIWVLKVLLSGMQNTGADGTITGEYNLHIINRSTTVLFINATTIDETFNNFTGYLVWDVVISGETFYPRVKLVGSSTYPENNIKLTALTTFTQYHYE
jgi:hypothetical protein